MMAVVAEGQYLPAAEKVFS